MKKNMFAKERRSVDIKKVDALSKIKSFEGVKKPFKQEFRNIPSINSLRFKIDPIQEYTMQIKMQKIPVYAEAVNRNMTKMFFNFLDYKVETNENITLEIRGQQRSGKSTGAISIHKYIAKRTGVPFTVDDILQNEQQYPEKVKYAVAHQGIIVDEQREQQTGLGSFRVMQHTEDLNNIVAKLCLNISWLHPPDFVGRGGFYGLETQGRNFEYKLTKFLLYDLNQKMFGMSSIPLGFVIIPKFNDIDFEKAYESKKDVGIDDIRNESIAVVQKMRLNEGFALAKNKLFNKCKNTHQRVQVARNLFPTRTEGEYMELVSIANMNTKLGINQDEFEVAKKQVDEELAKQKEELESKQK